MRQTLDYSKQPRAGALRSALIAIGVVFAVLVLAVGGLVAFIAYEFSQMSRIDLNVKNDSTFLVNADVAGHVAVKSVKQGESADASKVVGNSVVTAPVTVTVGSSVYVADAGYLLDDDGPHRFWIVVAADGTLTVTRQSNEGPWQLKMEKVANSGSPTAK